MNNYTEDISKFPISEKLELITEALKKSPTRFMILTAETAAGKSTILPLQLLKDFDGKILMTEPRRLAVLGVADRVSQLIGEKVGEIVGYKIHLENKISKSTRLEIVTEAILVRQLQSDSILENYNVVVLDEFHERSVNVDLALAFLKEAMELREDLHVIIMSATIDTDKIKKYLGEDTPVIKIPGRQFPVSVEYNNSLSVEKAIIQELSTKNKKGNILVFLPGIKEIRKVQEILKNDYGVGINSSDDIEICILHSSISLSEQKKILKESERRRVILSSAIAETSLTVPGVTCVIDCGLSRVNRMNVETGMEGLYTETESDFSAAQRKGRAGRLQAGSCIRLWSEADPRIKEMPSEILRADLTTLVLECAERGIYSADKIQWLDTPSVASWNGCVELLKMLCMLKNDGRITEKGRNALKLGIHPRLAGIALDNFNVGKSLILKYSSYEKTSPEIQKRFICDLEKRVNSIKNKNYENTTNKLIMLSGYPDRLCKKISEEGKKTEIYELPSGRNAMLAEGKHGSEWIVAPDILIGSRNTVIFGFENLPEDEIERWLENKTEKNNLCVFENGKIKKTENICFGKIILSSRKVQIGPEDLAEAWINEIKEKGINSIPISEKTKKFLLRVEFFWENKKKEEDLKIYIEKNVREWLPSFLGNNKALTEDIVYNSLFWFLDGDKINKEVPEIIILPNGKKAKVKYERLASPEDKNKLIIRPVIEIIIQRIFGCFTTPVICGIKVLLRLLSPASRPLQITDDLEGFWKGAWPEICKEMKGRYPKHNWDEKVCLEKGE